MINFYNNFLKEILVKENFKFINLKYKKTNKYKVILEYKE